MTLTARQHTVLATVLIIVVSYLVRIGDVEIQPWDEGLYAVRGESIVKYGTVWDQTEHTIGGLYSSIPAPMTSWHVAIGVAVFGRTALGVRIIGILDAGIALLLLYAILYRLVPHRMALFGVLACGTSLHWVIYARQAMSEVPLMTYTLLALWAIFRLREELQKNPDWNRPEVLLNIGLFGVGLGFSMLTKLVVGALPMLFLLPLVISRPTRIAGFLGACIGLVIALPWYISMIIAHGQLFVDALMLRHVTSVVEGNEQKLGPFYYLNQLIVAQPLLLLAFVFHFKRIGPIVMGLRNVFRRQPGMRNESWQEGIVFTWFALAFLVLTLAPTKNPHYVVSLIPAGVIVATYSFERLLQTASRRWLLFVIMVLVVASVWSAIPEMRYAVKQDPMSFMPYAIAALLIGTIPFVLKRSWVDVIAVRLYTPILAIVLASSVFTSAMLIWKHRYAWYISGGREVATRLVDSGMHSFTYLYHEQTGADSLNPQLAWYTAGWMLHEEPGRTFHPVALPEYSSSLDAVAQVTFSGDPYVVYYHTSASKATQTEVLATLAVGYRVEFENEHYTLLIRGR